MLTNKSKPPSQKPCKKFHKPSNGCAQALASSNSPWKSHKPGSRTAAQQPTTNKLVLLGKIYKPSNVDNKKAQALPRPHKTVQQWKQTRLSHQQPSLENPTSPDSSTSGVAGWQNLQAQQRCTIMNKLKPCHTNKLKPCHTCTSAAAQNKQAEPPPAYPVLQTLLGKSTSPVTKTTTTTTNKQQQKQTRLS